MITIRRGNIFAWTDDQNKVAGDILGNLEGKRLKRLHPSFLRNIENNIKDKLTASNPLVHSITYPDQQSFVDVTFLKRPRKKWLMPIGRGSIYHLRRLQNKIGKLIEKGQQVTKNSHTGRYENSDLVGMEDTVRRSLSKELDSIITIINQCKNLKEKAEHILLLQFAEPSDKILNILYKSLSGDDEIVLNNAAYVLGNYLARHKPTRKQLNQIISLLNSPFSAPINKGLYLLSILVNLGIPKSYRTLICKMAHRFLDNRQPNIHKIANMIVVKCQNRSDIQ